MNFSKSYLEANKENALRKYNKIYGGASGVCLFHDFNTIRRGHIMPQLRDPLPDLSVISVELRNYILEGERGSEGEGFGDYGYLRD